MLRRVTRRVEHFSGDVAQFNDVFIARRQMVIRRGGAGVQNVLRPGFLRELPAPGDVVSVSVRVDHVVDRHPERFRFTKVGSNVLKGIDNRTGRLSGAPD